MKNDSAIYITEAGLRGLQTSLLSKNESMALWWIVANLPIGGGVLTIQAVQENCGIEHQAVGSKVLKRLVETGFIRRMSKVGKSYFYRLNPNWFRPAV